MKNWPDRRRQNDGCPSLERFRLSRGLDFRLEISQFDELRCPEKNLVKVSPKVFQGGLALSVFFTSEEFGFQLSAKTDFSLNFYVAHLRC